MQRRRKQSQPSIRPRCEPSPWHSSEYIASNDSTRGLALFPLHIRFTPESRSTQPIPLAPPSPSFVRARTLEKERGQWPTNINVAANPRIPSLLTYLPTFIPPVDPVPPLLSCTTAVVGRSARGFFFSFFILLLSRCLYDEFATMNYGKCFRVVLSTAVSFFFLFFLKIPVGFFSGYCILKNFLFRDKEMEEWSEGMPRYFFLV